MEKLLLLSLILALSSCTSDKKYEAIISIQGDSIYQDTVYYIDNFAIGEKKFVVNADKVTSNNKHQCLYTLTLSGKQGIYAELYKSLDPIIILSTKCTRIN